FDSGDRLLCETSLVIGGILLEGHPAQAELHIELGRGEPGQRVQDGVGLRLGDHDGVRTRERLVIPRLVHPIAVRRTTEAGEGGFPGVRAHSVPQPVCRQRSMSAAATFRAPCFSTKGRILAASSRKGNPPYPAALHTSQNSSSL